MSARPSAVLSFARSPQRVLVIVTRRIGDVLLATPVLRSLAQAWPHAQIDALVFAGTQGFLMGNPDIRHVLTVAERPRRLEHLRFVLSLARRYDLALSLVPGDRPTLYAWVAGRRRVGLVVDAAKSRWKRALLDAWVPFDNDETHTVRMHLALLQAINVRASEKLVVTWDKDDEKLVSALLASVADSPLAVLHPYPKFRYKMWTEEGWVAVADWLTQQGYAVVLTGGADEAERAYVRRIAARVPDALDLSGKLGLGGVAHVLARAAVYVGPDTAITHAAAALGVKTVALFGPTNPVKWGPWPAGHTVVSNPWARKGTQRLRNVRLIQGAGLCVPCGNEGCERHVESTSDCLTGLSPDSVIAALREVLS